MAEQNNTHLKFFGIGRILPFLRTVRSSIFIMVVSGSYALWLWKKA